MRANAIALAVAFALLNLSASANEEPNDLPELAVVVENYRDGETQSYPIALLEGTIVGEDSGVVVVENLSSNRRDRISRANAFEGRFKVLIELVPGENRLLLSSGAKSESLTLNYRTSSNPHFVRLVYFVDSSGDLTFPQDDSWEPRSKDFAQKMRVAALLWQTATAESFRKAGLGRRTFTLEFDKEGNVVVWIKRGKKRVEEYLEMSEKDLFRQTRKEILADDGNSLFAKNFAMIAFARREPNNGDVRGRVALGGGGIGILDASTLFAWPDSLESVPTLFSDSSPIPQNYLRDSAYRNARWALASSSLGAGLHELGHAFDLDHSDDPCDFMSRGFDMFNRIFTPFEPGFASEDGSFSETETARWGKSSVARLLSSPWIKE